MTDTDVQQLLRQAVANNDAAAMRTAFDRLLDAGPDALSPQDKYRTRREDYVMEMPQSGERIRGRDRMLAMQEAYPTPPTITLRRVVGLGPVWIVDGVNDYAGDVWHVVVILELDSEGSNHAGHAILRETLRSAGMAVELGRTDVIPAARRFAAGSAGGHLQIRPQKPE